MTLELLIIADDLTGAADTAVQFSKQGIPAAVRLSAETGFASAPAVAAVTTESRHCPADEAYRRVTSAAEAGLRAGCRRFYKKIDSTFRGNAGAELDALMTVTGVRRLALVPAYPAAGRTTRGGVQYVNGTPLHESSFAHDPREPATESFIPSILALQTRRAVRLAGASGGEDGDGITVYDAQSGGELKAAGAVLERSGGLDVSAGAAGFAEVIADKLAFTEKKDRDFSPKKTGVSALFVVNGSLNEVSLGQVEQAVKEGIACFTVPSDSTPAGFVSSVARELHKNGCAVLTTERAYGETSIHAANAGRAAAAVLASVPGAAVAVFGGDTAFEVCRRMDWNTLYPRIEIMPGLTVCSAGRPSGRLMISKSGGFGSEDIIRKIRSCIEV